MEPEGAAVYADHFWGDSGGIRRGSGKASAGSARRLNGNCTRRKDFGNVAVDSSSEGPALRVGELVSENQDKVDKEPDDDENRRDSQREGRGERE